MKYSISYLATLALIGAMPAWAIDAPVTDGGDARIHHLEYKTDSVNQIRVQRGVVTRIILERDEQILIPVVGLSADCTAPNDEWCISAIAGSNQIFVRPRDNASSNNMELHTNKRDYSFVFQVVGGTVSPGKRTEQQTPFFRVVFQYPAPKNLAIAMTPGERSAVVDGLLRRIDNVSATPLPTAVHPNQGMSAAQQLAAEGIEVRNTNYTKQVLPKGEDADPSMVFDDGRFTYFEFAGSREIPAIFAYGSDGESKRVNWHMNGSLVVVQRMARKFTIRLGDAVVGIFNEAFDPTGVDTPTSTVSPSVTREIKGGTQ